MTAGGSCRRCVNHNARYREHRAGKDDVSLAVGVNGAGVSVTFVCQIATCNIHPFFKVIVRKSAHYGAHLFAADAVFSANTLCFHNNYARSFRYGDTRHLGDLLYALTYYILIDGAIIVEKNFAYLFAFFVVADIGTVTLECSKYGILICLVVDNALFTGADDTVVVSTTGDELFGSCIEIDVAIENYLYVTGTNTCLLYTSPSPRDGLLSRMPSSA